MTYDEQFRELCVTCFHYFGLKRVDEVLDMTFEDIRIGLDAYKKRRVDKEHDMHWQAYLNLKVQAKKEVNGGKEFKYIYARYEDFFDRKKVEAKMFGREVEKSPEEREKEDRIRSIDQLMLEANSIDA